MQNSGLENSSVEASSLEKPRNRNRRRTGSDENQQPYSVTSEDKRAKRIKSAVRASRERLSLDALPANSNLPTDGGQRRKKRSTENDNDSDAVVKTRPTRSTKKSPKQRLPRSVSEEVLALEGRFNPNPIGEQEDSGRSRRPRVQKRERSETDPMQLSIERPPTGRRQTGNKDVKRKKKTRSAIVASGGEEEDYQGDGEISEIFQVDKEDIIPSSELNLSSSSKLHAIHSFVAPPVLPSQPNDILFIEKKDGKGFVREHKDRVSKFQNQTDYSAQLLEDDKRYTTLDFMLKVHVAFRGFAMIAHGLLAGVALSQCVFVYTLDNTSDTTLLQNYYQLALPYQSVYYFLLAICVVSILDRYVNISSGWSQFILRILSRPSRAIAIVSYFFALVFSVCLAQLDDKISLYTDIPSLWKSKDSLSTWKVINLLRVIGSVLGWIMVAIAPTDDQTANTIKSAIEQENVASAGKFELNSVRSTPIHTWDRVNP